jgi:hypothetical protein
MATYRLRFTLELDKLAVTGEEDALQRGLLRQRLLLPFAVELGEIAALAKALLEAVQQALAAVQRGAATDNQVPAGERSQHQEHHHRLHHQAGLADQAPDGHVLESRLHESFLLPAWAAAIGWRVGYRAMTSIQTQRIGDG